MQMKKRVLSAFMALCMVCSLVGAAWAVIPQQTSAANGQFTITWQKDRQTQKVEISCYDYDNEDQTLSVSPENFTVQSGGTVSFVSTNQDLQIDGYEFVEAKYQSWYQWQNLTSLQVIRDNRSWEYYVDGERVYSEPTIRLYYRSTGGDSSDDGSTVTSATVTTGKTAYLRDDGNYDLTLSITGDRGSETNPAKLDVLFILDVSNSMGNTWSRNETRIDVAKDAIDQITSGLSSNDALDVRYALVAFGGGDSTKSNPYKDAGTEQTWTADASNVVNEVPNVYNYGIIASNLYGGGTNYEAGIRTGKDVLKTSRANAETVVIFITDGNPGYYYNDNGATAGDGSPSNYNDKALEHAVSELKGLNTDYFYVVGVTNSVDSKVFNDMVAAVGVPSSNKDSYTANDADELLEIFEKIEGSITFFAASDVTITDTLSEYAEMVLDANNNPQFTITVTRAAYKDSNGQSHEAKTWETETPVGNNGTLTFKDAEDKDVTVTASYNSTTKTITLDFPEDYQLEEGYTYSVSTVITPSAEATSIGQGGYNGYGESNTGTHSNDSGFYSNGNAEVTYTSNNVQGSEPFPKPVIQVPEPTTTQLTLTKTFDGLSDAEVSYLLFGPDPSSKSEKELTEYIDKNCFGFDVNYCVADAIEDEEDGKLSFMAPASDVEGLKLPDGTLLTELGNGGGGYRIAAGNYLSNKDITSYEDNSYVDAQTGASLTKDDNGNWTFSITLEVPITDDDHFFTVFEQHQEVPGYAKINDSNAVWEIRSGEDAEPTSGTGKFIDMENNNIYESMKEINDDTEYGGNTYSQMEDVCIAAGAFKRIEITQPTTISFTNHYTGKLDVTKEMGKDNEPNVDEKEFTITLSPAHSDKLNLGNSTNGLEGKTGSYTIETGGTTSDDIPWKIEDGVITIKLKADQTAHFYDLPAIQWQVTEDDAKAKENGYTLKVEITDENNSVVDDAEHWNGYNKGETIGGSKSDDCIASVDSAIHDIDAVVGGAPSYAVKKDSVAKVTITNTYTNKTLAISKTVDGSMGNTQQEFTFTLTITDGNGNKITDAEYGVIASTAKIDGNQSFSFENGSASFTLKDGQKLTIDVPDGYTCTVTEAAEGAYTTTIGVKDDDGETLEKWTTKDSTASGTITVDTNVGYINTLEIGAPTGLSDNNNLPFTLMISAAGLAGIALIATILVRRQRRRRE